MLLNGPKQWLELMLTMRERTTELSPKGLASALGAQTDRFKTVGDEWLLSDAVASTVNFELWLNQREVEAHIHLRDERLSRQYCESILEAAVGPGEHGRSNKRHGTWITYPGAGELREAAFIFDGTGEALYLEMIVVREPRAGKWSMHG
jgi:hypothetical protein